MEPAVQRTAESRANPLSPVPGDNLARRSEFPEVMKLLDMSSAVGPLAQLKGKKPMAEVSMPGMSTIFGDASIWRRITWAFFMALCFTIATIQVVDRVKHYLSTPVAVNVRVTMNDDLRFPAVTICNRNLFNVTEIDRLWLKRAADVGHFGAPVTGKKEWRNNISYVVGVDGMDAQQVWNATLHRLDDIVKECFFGRGARCLEVGTWQTVYTYMGVCYTFLLNHDSVKTSGIFNHMYLKLVDQADTFYKKDDGWKILIHDRRDSPVIDIRTHGNNLNRGWGKDIRIYLREFKTLDTKERPCTSDGSYSQCLATCFIANATSRMTCRLPFMTGSDLNYCPTMASYINAEKQLDNMLFYGNWTSGPCNCVRQCRQDIYVASSETYQMNDNEKDLSKIRIYYQDLTFDDIEESFDYGYVSLLCDIGGSLGFLLGISVLTMFEIFDALFRAFMRSARQYLNKCRTPVRQEY